MENCYSLQESDLLHEIIKAIKRNEHDLLDFIVQDILRDRDFKDLLDREIEIEDVPVDPEEPEEPKNGMILKIDFNREVNADPTQPNIFELYLSGNGTILIDWGDGTSEEVNLTASNAPISHQYDNKKEYKITIYGQEDNPNQEISFGSRSDLSETNKYLKEIVSWGDLILTSLSGALNSTIEPLTVPNILPLTVRDLSYLLYESTVSEVSNIQNWNTSLVTNMSYTFAGATEFNQDIGGWDTRNVIIMNGMFSGATEFNQDIGGWNTRNVIIMNGMFSGATNFYRDLSGWCVFQIPSEPIGFNTGSEFANNEDFQPDWGVQC